MLVEGVLWNSSAVIEKNEEPDGEEYVTRGNVTEQGLLKFFMGVLGPVGTIEQMKRL